ncbi:MAG: DUF5309 family protein [Phycisphaerales bacterium]|nr:DUF5309 family protein [Phycisphaerales bacterium]
MPFSGKATYSAGTDLPELVEDVSDIVSIVSPYETPLLDLIGDARRVAHSTLHEWLEASLLPNTDAVNQSSFSPNATDATSITVDNGARFRVGDQVRPEAAFREIMLVTAVAGNVLTVVRRYGATTGGALADNMVLTIVGNAALEGDDRPAAQVTVRARKRNYTQIFTSAVEVSGSMLASRAHAVADEMGYQKSERLREMLRDLENCVINGVAPAANPQGSASVRRTMNGLVALLTTNAFTPGVGPVAPGGGGGNILNEAVLNSALRAVWEQSSTRIDTILVGGTQKRRLNEIMNNSRLFDANETRLTNRVAIYESDFGVCRVVLSRYMPADSMLLLDSSRLSVLPLAGRSFHFKPLAPTGDKASGMLLGEYTLEVQNENAHALVRGLATT